MKKVKYFISKVLISIATYASFVNWLGGFLIHIYTVTFAYKSSGVLSALLTLMMPILAQIYWVVKMCYITGSFSNDFSHKILVYLAWLPVPLILIIVASWFNEEQ